MKMLLTMCCSGCNKLLIRRYTCSRTWRILTTTTCFRGAHAFIIVPFHDILTVQTCECVAQFLRMDPNLLRECAQRLIETADFIWGSGVNGGSVASSSAPSNTSNTRPRTDDSTSISSGSSGSHRAVPNTAPSVSESAWQEHNRIFGYRPPGSSRQGRNFPRNSRQSGRNGKAHGRAAANASWSRSFICLANAGQGCPPSTSERIELNLNGLGEKKIIFPKDGDAGMFMKRFSNAFPRFAQVTSCSEQGMVVLKICYSYLCHRTDAL